MKPMAKIALLSLALLCLLIGAASQAQSPAGQVLYGQTVGGIFSPGDEQDRWEFEASGREILEVQVLRISGQFQPQVRLLDAEGRAVEASENQAGPFGQTLIFREGLSGRGVYQLEVSGQGVQGLADNPDEYSLTLRQIGERLPNIEAGLSIPPAPPAMPALEQGLLVTGDERDRLGNLVIYGETVVSRPEPGPRPQNFEVQGQNFSIAILQNGNTLSRMIRSISFVEGGIGILGLPPREDDSQAPPRFFTDQNISRLENTTTTLSLTLANGQFIRTDFYRFSEIQALGGLVFVTTRQGQRIVLSGTSFDLTQLANSDLNQILLEGDQFIQTDLAGWDTLAYVEGELSLLAGDNFRLFGDQLNLRLTSPGPGLFLMDWEGVALNLETFGLGDIRLQAGQFSLRPLNGREFSEPFGNLRRVLTEQGAIQIQRADGSYRRSFPDGTEIETPAADGRSGQFFPNDPQFSPLGYNNLGPDPLPTCPCLQNLGPLAPVNPLNGNFYYPLQDIFVPGAALSLEFSRHYNSQGPETTPAYLLNSPQPYFLGDLGPGWRHSAQIELDIQYAPLGNVKLILPTGTAFLFFESPSTPGRFLSEQAPMWMLERLGGQLGAWQATRTDGLRYKFDRLGRLEQVQAATGGIIPQALYFSPIPADYLSGEAAGGFFLLEPYGRRLEVYTNAQNQIIETRAPDGTGRTYRYNPQGELVEVKGPGLPASTYAYSNNLLTGIEEWNNPYHQSLALAYGPDGEVSSYTESPSGQTSHRLTYDYDREGFSTAQTSTVNGQARRQVWTYDERGRLLSHEAGQGWVARLDYRQESDALYQVAAYRAPEGFLIRLDFNPQGLLTGFADPSIEGAAQNTTLIYEALPDGHQQRLSELRYGGTLAFDRFSYNEAGQLISRASSLEVRQEPSRLSRYEYDDWGRLAALYEPGPEGQEVATTYQYDAFGYVSEISQGDGARVWLFIHDRMGRLLSLRDGRGQTTTLKWEAGTNRLRAINYPLDYRQTYAYNERGLLTEINDGGAITQYAYNDLNQAISQTEQVSNLGAEALTQTTLYTYDEVGNLLSRQAPDGATSQYVYDELNRLIQATRPSGIVNTYAYGPLLTPEGRPTGRYQQTWTDGAGRQGALIYDPGGRLREARLVDRNGNVVFQYRVEQSVLGESILTERLAGAPGRQTEVRYNLQGLPISSDLNGARTTYTYNPAGYVETITDPAGYTTRYSYDALGNMSSISLPGTEDLESTYQYRYDENGNRLSSTDPLGQTTLYAYDELNRLESSTDPLGRQTSYTYDLRGNLLSLTDPAGNIRSASYDDLNRLIESQDGLGNIINYAYNPAGLLSETAFPRGLSVRYTYDLDGNLIAVSQPNANNLLYSYDDLGRLISAGDALGRTRLYTYDRLDQIRSLTDPLGNASEYRWNSNGRLGRFEDAQGSQYVYSFDPVGRLRQIAAQNEQTTSLNQIFTYDPAGYLLEYRLGTGQVLNSNAALIHEYSYYPQGWLRSYTDPEGGVWLYSYDAKGQVLAIEDPGSGLTRYTYDAAGQITQILHAAGTPLERAEAFEYDENGNLSRYRSPDGLTREYVYNASLQLTQVTERGQDGAERVYRYAYDELGYLSLVINPLDQRSDYTYDLFGRLVLMTHYLPDDTGEAQPIIHSFQYDDVGNLVGLTLPEGLPLADGRAPADDYRVSLTYNALDRRVRYVDAEDNVWAYQYDREGRLLEMSDPLGSTTRYQYDAMGRAVLIEYPNGARFNLTYDGVGNLNRLALPPTEVRAVTGNNETLAFTPEAITYNLDRLGRVVSIDELDNSRIQFEYDPLGHLTRLQYADGAALTYQYDELGRLMQAQSNDETLRYAYDERGYLSSLSGQAGTYAFSYDSLGGLSAINSPGLEITYERDLLGRVLVREAGDFGKTQYRYDSLGRLIRAELGEDWVDYAYNRNGWLDSLSRSNGVTSFYSYDSNGRPLNIIHAGPEGLIDQLAYTYDSVGNIARLNRQDWTILYSYDAAHQVISERWLDPNNQTRYTLNIRYDEAGNRAEMLLSEAGERSPNRTLYSYNRYNQLVAVIRNYVPTDDLADSPPPEKASEYRINYRYDERGNLIEVRHPEGTGIGWELAYDGQNRLLTIEGIAEDGQAINTRLSYDPLGRISEWQASEGAYRFYYEADTPALVGIENLTTGEQQAVLTGPGGEVLLSQGLQEVWYHHDLLNSTRRLTDESGALIGGGGYDYNAFGDLIQPYPAETPPLSAPGLFPLFAGQFYDPSTGLYLMGLRAYDPAAGRFIQRDPLRHDPQANLYTYAYNRPGVYIDPQGTSPQAALSASGAGLIPQHILPQAQVPPLLPELPTPPATHDLQAAENFRALALGQSLRWQWNETTSLLSPTLDSFYMYRLNPAPALAIQAAAMGGDSLLTTYQGGEAWGFLGAPSPLHNPAPQAWFGEVNLAFAGALSSRLDWCAAPMRGPYLALPTPPPGPPEVTFGQLGPLFAETPLYSSLQPQIQSLIPIPEFALRPPTQAATIFPPQALVNPVMLSEIEALQAQQRALYEQNFSLGGLPGGD